MNLIILDLSCELDNLEPSCELDNLEPSSELWLDVEPARLCRARLPDHRVQYRPERELHHYRDAHVSPRTEKSKYKGRGYVLNDMYRSKFKRMF